MMEYFFLYFIYLPGNLYTYNFDAIVKDYTNNSRNNVFPLEKIGRRDNNTPHAAAICSILCARGARA